MFSNYNMFKTFEGKHFRVILISLVLVYLPHYLSLAGKLMNGLYRKFAFNFVITIRCCR